MSFTRRTPEEVLSKAKKDGVEIVDIRFCDLPGLMQHFSIPAHELTEGAFWGATIRLGGADAMAVGGIVNASGNIGGIIGIPIVAYLSGRHQWGVAFLIGSLTAALSALVWLVIKPAPVATRRS